MINFHNRLLKERYLFLSNVFCLLTNRYTSVSNILAKSGLYLPLLWVYVPQRAQQDV